MAISQINAWLGNNAGAGQTTSNDVVNTSSGSQIQSGDLLFIWVSNYAGAGGETTISMVSSGWNPAGSPWGFTTAGTVNGAFFYKVATSGDVGASFTLTNGNVNTWWNTVLTNWRGVSNSNPIDVVGTGTSGGTGPTNLGITVVTSGACVVWVAFCYNNIGVPTSYSTAYDGTPSQPTAVAYLLNQPSGATGTVSGTGNSNYLCNMIAFDPAPAATTITVAYNYVDDWMTDY